MTNFKNETLQVLESKNKKQKDILFATDGKNYIDKDEFFELADFNYDDGFGGNEIFMGLKLVGKDFWLERHEYDGSEWWEYKTMPTKPEHKDKIIIKEEDYDWTANLK